MRSAEPKRDRRAQRTRKLLGDALISLIREKNYESIAVQEILDRANVGRSTFYTHYRDKDELLVNGIESMIRPVRDSKLTLSARPHERLLSFSLPIFEHHDRHRHRGEQRLGERGRVVLHEHLRKFLIERMAGEIRPLPRVCSRSAVEIPPHLVVEYIASTFVLVLNWWVESGSRLSPKEVDEIFRAMVSPTLI
jgi:AcrR family transcriptional regulator